MGQIYSSPRTVHEKTFAVHCEDCRPAHAPVRRVYMSLMLNKGWVCQFFEEDLKTSLPRKVALDDSEKHFEMAERGDGYRTLRPVKCSDTALRLGVAASG
jgi:hypothetical protein